MSSVVVYMYFEPALATMFCGLVPEYKKYLMKDDWMVVKLDKALYRDVSSLSSVDINISKVLWRGWGSYLTQ